MIINGDSSRFWNKVVKSNNCWDWVGSTNGVGYGELRVAGKKLYAHRISYVMSKGEIPTGLHIDHLCRNRSCVNPEHLEAVTQKVNIQRGMKHRKDTHKTHCINGHNLEDSYIRHDGKGRNCRLCNLNRVKEYQARKRQAA